MTDLHESVYNISVECIECGEKRPEKFYPYKKSRCKACYSKRQMALYYPTRNKKKIAEYRAKYYREWYRRNGRKRVRGYQDTVILWRNNHPESCQVAILVRAAINKGLLKRPSECAMCGGGGRINAHHKDYNFPYDIMWLCSSCHKKVHLEAKV